MIALNWEMFKSLIYFMQAILKIACCKSESCETLRLSNKNLRTKISKISNERKRNGKSRSTKYRHLAKMNKCFEINADHCTKSVEELTNEWINMQFFKDQNMFITNKNISSSFHRKFVQKQKQLWLNYHRNKDKILNETLNFVNTRASYHQIQSNRVAVSKQSIQTNNMNKQSIQTNNINKQSIQTNKQYK